MAGSKEIRTKIKSVENTRKITKAMEMVAASKMRKAQDRMTAARPYAEKIRSVAAHLSHAQSEYKHPFIIERENIKNIGLIVVTSDKGLCGGLNTNVLRSSIAESIFWSEPSSPPHHFSNASANWGSNKLPRLLTPRLPEEPFPNLILIFLRLASRFILATVISSDNILVTLTLLFCPKSMLIGVSVVLAKSVYNETISEILSLGNLFFSNPTVSSETDLGKNVYAIIKFL